MCIGVKLEQIHFYYIIITLPTNRRTVFYYSAFVRYPSFPFLLLYFTVRIHSNLLFNLMYWFEINEPENTLLDNKVLFKYFQW